jgi:hypothetical protein
VRVPRNGPRGRRQAFKKRTRKAPPSSTWGGTSFSSAFALVGGELKEVDERMRIAVPGTVRMRLLRSAIVGAQGNVYITVDDMH